MFDLILKAVRSLFNKYDKKIADAVEKSKSPYWENVQDKPFENNLRTGELLNTIVHFGDSQLMEMVNTSNNTPVPNEMYTVNWNGKDYECMAIEPINSSAYQGHIVLGNLSVIGLDSPNGNVEPFMIMFTVEPDESGKLQIMLVRFDDSESASVTVTGMYGELKQLDEQFLQESAKTALLVSFSVIGSSAGEGYKLDHESDYYKALTAVVAGRTVYLTYGNDRIRAVYIGQNNHYTDEMQFLCMETILESGTEVGREVCVYGVNPDGSVVRYKL